MLQRAIFCFAELLDIPLKFLKDTTTPVDDDP